MKRESYDIQSIKREPEPQAQTPMESCNSKFSGYFGWSSYVHEVPQYPIENGIYVSPIEELTRNPYKSQKQAENGDMSYQKYPMLQDNNWLPNNEGANYMAAASLAFGKKELLAKDDGILAQLFDLSGMLNDDSPYNIPSCDDMLIPVQTPSPTMITETTNQTQTHYQPAEQSPQGCSNSHHYNNMMPYSVSPDNGGSSTIDPLVSIINEDRLSPPNNDLYPEAEIIEKSNDELQILLNEILAVENLPMESNTFGPDNSHNNEIPSIPMTPVEDNNEIGSVKSNEDMSIPFDTFQFPPPTKKRLSESSSGSVMDESPPSSSSHVMEPQLSSPEPLHSPTSDQDTGSPRIPTYKNRVPATLFGQKEDEIIDKLLFPKHGSNTKPVTRDKLVTMNVEDFNTLLDQVGLTEIEVAFMKEWRRRGKNKMAAQVARKRKRDELSELQDEIDLLRRRKAQLKQSVYNLKTKTNTFKKRTQASEERIYKKYSAAHGILVSRDTHNIHVTDDDKTMLVPRISSQILLV